jgi:hypothetical protein
MCTKLGKLSIYFEVGIMISIESKTESIDAQKKKISIRDCISIRVR